MKKIIFVSLLCLTIISCARKVHEEKSVEVARVPVKVTEAKLDSLYETISLSGDILGQKEAKVYPKVPGKLVQKIKVEGELVKENQPIALINRDEIALNYADAQVRSPINGIVTRYYVGIGETVVPMQVPIAEVANIDKLNIEVYISEIDFPKVKKGQKAKITIDVLPDRVFYGNVVDIEPVINPMTRKSKVKIELNNEGWIIRPGMFANVEIIVSKIEGIVVPLTAVIEKYDQKYVFVVEQNNIAKKVLVETGFRDKENIIIKSGLKGKEKVVYEGNFSLVDGLKVEY